MLNTTLPRRCCSISSTSSVTLAPALNSRGSSTFIIFKSNSIENLLFLFQMIFKFDFVRQILPHGKVDESLVETSPTIRERIYKHLHPNQKESPGRNVQKWKKNPHIYLDIARRSAGKWTTGHCKKTFDSFHGHDRLLRLLDGRERVHPKHQHSCQSSWNRSIHLLKIP